MGIKLSGTGDNLSIYDEGTFTTSASKVSDDSDLTSPSAGITATFTRVGNEVTISFGYGTGLIYAGSNDGVTFYLTGWPTALIPTTSKICQIAYTITDAGSVEGYVCMSSNGKMYVLDAAYALAALAASLSNNFALKRVAASPAASCEMEIHYTLT